MTEPAVADANLRRSLNALAALGDAAAIRSRDLSRTHRERLLAHGRLREVMKGWYVPVRPGRPGDAARSWYEAFWGFCAGYLETRFGRDWCLSSEPSLAIHTGDWSIPAQLVARAGRGSNKPLTLPHDTSLLDLRLQPPPAQRLEVRALGVRIMDLESALIATPAAGYAATPRLLQAALWLLDDGFSLSARLIEGSHSKVAGRLIGALRQVGRHDVAAAIADTMQAAGFGVSPTAPFPRPSVPGLAARDPSPYPNRQSLRRRWAAMRPAVLAAWPAQTPASAGAEPPAEAVHPAMAAGYQDLCKRLAAADGGEGGDGGNAAAMFRRDHGEWHRHLLAPAVAAGQVPADSAGTYRAHSLYRRGSAHTPPRHEAMRDLLPVLFELLEAETDCRVAAVLGHWQLTLLAPFEHGNRLLAQALSRHLLAAAGHPQGAPVPTLSAAYMAALDSARVEDDPRALTQLLAGATA